MVHEDTRREWQLLLKGVIDAGLEVPADPQTFPSEERIQGKFLSVKNDTATVKSSIDARGKIIESSYFNNTN